MFSVANFYWILYLLFELSSATSVSILLVRVAWAGFSVSNFLELSMICEQISEQVSIATMDGELENLSDRSAQSDPVSVPCRN